MRQGQLRAVLGYLHRVANPDGGGPGDAQLLGRWCSQHDATALEVLVWRHGAMVWNVCRRILVREQDVEDAFQATFLTFLRKADTIGQGRFLGSWLYKVAFRTALAARAASARGAANQQLDAELEAPAATDGDGWDELGPILDEEVSRLPEKYRRPFVLCYLEGKTTDEAAQDLGCPRGTVGTRLAWARERLRVRLRRRGLALSAAGLATLLVEKAAGASVPAPAVACVVKAATLSTSTKALAAGVISARAAALSQGVLQALFITKLKSVALVLFVVALLGGGVGLLVQQGSANPDKPNVRIAKAEPEPPPRPVNNAGDTNVPVDPPSAFESDFAMPTSDPPAAQGKDQKSDSLQVSGTVVRVDGDGKRLSLEIPSKVKGEAARRDISITDRTELLFSNVGPNETTLTAGQSAVVWLEKDDAAARIHLSGNRNSKSVPHRSGRVLGVAADGKGVTLEKQTKGEATEKLAIRFTNTTRVTFANVGRDRASMTTGYECQVWLEENSTDAARSVTFLGSAEDKAAASKDQKPDRTGRVVGVSGDGKAVTVELPPAKGKEPTRFEIKLTDATSESYHGVPFGGARPAIGHQVQAWLAEGSQDAAARARFFGNDPRQSVNGRIVAVSKDGDGFTVEVPTKIKGGEPSRLEIKTTTRTRVTFVNVGPGGAGLTEGYHVRGLLEERSHDTADELIVSRVEKPDDKQPTDKKPIDKK